MIDPTPECVRQVHDLTASDPVLITLAPERTGALDAFVLRFLSGCG